MIKRTLLILFSLWTLASSAQILLSPEAEIRAMTLGAFQPELYSVFGHSAFRVKDPVNKLDLVFNYGVFDFDQSNFYLNFFQGTPYYRLGVTDYGRFKRIYVYHDRSVYEQVLNLDSAQRQQVYNYLANNYKPENRNYIYNYFSDNCATKLRDVMEEVLGKKNLILGDSFNDDSSIRELMNDRMALQPWGHLAFNLFLANIDSPAKTRQYLYLPEYVRQSFSEAIVISEDGSRKPLVKSEEEVYLSQGLVKFNAPWFTPSVLFILIFVLSVIVSGWDWLRGDRARFFDAVLYGVIGFVGVLLFYLWFFSNHTSQYNWNIMWAWPSHLFMVWAIGKKKLSSLTRNYLMIAAGVGCLFILIRWFLPAYIPVYLLWLVGAIVVRGFFAKFIAPDC